MTRSEIRWVSEAVVLAVHDAQLAEHGGVSGLLDQSLLLSALARPRNISTYGKPDLADLAAAYTIGIARNRAFVDGNKRTAIVVAGGVFLPVNGYELSAESKEVVRVMLAVADGSISEPQLAAWFREWMRALAEERG
jgi:death on curing protein